MWSLIALPRTGNEDQEPSRFTPNTTSDVAVKAMAGDRVADPATAGLNRDRPVLVLLHVVVRERAYGTAGDVDSPNAIRPPVVAKLKIVGKLAIAGVGATTAMEVRSHLLGVPVAGWRGRLVDG